MNLGNLSKTISEDKLPLLEETKIILSEIIGDLRHISKSISPRQIADFGLADAINYQVSRTNKTGEINADLLITGEKRSFNPPVELVLFRMVQELMNNAIKHSGCKNINILLGYEEEKISIIVKDDGKGFDKAAIERSANFKDGTGLHSLEQKARNINCSIAFNSSSNGTNVTLIKNFQNEKH